MAEVSRFLGIIIRMYTETGAQHHIPHFHAYYQNEVAAFRIDTGDLLTGSLPSRQRNQVKVWAQIHRLELLENWRRADAGEPVFRIQPLEK